MWNYFLTGYIFLTAIFLFLCVLGLILPPLFFGNRIVEEKVGRIEDKSAREKLRIDKKAEFYKEKFRQL